MKRILKTISTKSDFIKNTLTLAAGAGIAQAFPIIFYPFLARMFTPLEFGLLATIGSITSILVVVSTMKYERSILICDTKQDAANIVGLVLLLSFSLLLTSFVLLQIFSHQISLLFDSNPIKKWLFIPPISAFFIVIYSLYNEWCVRNKYFISLSWNKVINSSSNTLSKVLLGIVKISSNGLILGDLIGRVISAVGCVFRVFRKDKEIFFKISLKEMRKLAKIHIEFPKFSLPDKLIDTINLQLPVLMIASFFFSTEVGYYSMALALLSLPASVISASIMDVFRQRANEEWLEKGNCNAIYIKVIKMMFLIIAPLSILLMIFLPSIIEFVLGEKWYKAGVYAQILVPNVALLFMFQVVSAVFIIANKMKASFVWQLFSIFLTSLSLFIGCYLFKDMELTLICYVIARLIANSYRFYMTYKYSKGLKLN